MKRIFSALIITLAFAACNGPEQNSTVGNSQDSNTIKGNDTPGDTHGSKGTGVDNSGGTSGAGTLTDTANGKVDTLDHTSHKK